MTTPRPTADPIESSNEPDADAARAARIAAQNDAFRRAVASGAVPHGLQGRVVVTHAVLARGDGFAQAALGAVAADTTFTEDNDPHGEHDFGAVEVAGAAMWWKIDLHDRDLRGASERPDDPAATVRVLTILMPEDW